MGKWVNKCVASLFLLCGLCMFSPLPCGPLNLGPFRAQFSGLMLPKLYDTFRFKVAHSHFCRLDFCAMFFS